MQLKKILTTSFVVYGVVVCAQTNLIAHADAYTEPAFEVNKGQIKDSERQPAPYVKYALQHGNTRLFMLPTGIAYQFEQMHYPTDYPINNQTPEDVEQMAALQTQIRKETYRMDMELVGANPNPRITAEGQSTNYTNYYTHQVLDVRTFSKLTYHDVYPHIDWVVYTTDKGLKYDFVVRPQGNPQAIQLKFRHHESIKIDADGSLTIANRMGSIREQTPISLQAGKLVATQFQLTGDVVSFRLATYDATRTLIIDPQVAWATYYGSTTNDFGKWCAADNNGNVYLAGYTNSTANIAVGGHQTVYGGGSYDAFLVKFDARGVRQWATYYGGGTSDYGNACATDARGNIYLVGYSNSTSNIASNGYQMTSNGSNDAFLVKFDSAGVRQWGTYFGGTGSDLAYSCAVDVYGNIILGGYTSSNANLGINGHQMSYGGSFDAFVARFDSTGGVRWASYYGGSSSDGSYSCGVDANGNVYLVGYTFSANNIASNGLQMTYGGVADAFIVKFDSTGVRQWGTYYGNTGNDYGTASIIDEQGDVYVAGYTSSASNVAYNGHQTIFNGNTDAFLLKLDSAGNRKWATYYGGIDNDYGQSCQLDNNGNVYLVGYTASTTEIAYNGLQNVRNGVRDAFVAKFRPNGARQWGTYYGGTSDDYAYSCAINAEQAIFLAGQTTSTAQFALNGHQDTLAGGTDAFLVKLSACIDSSSVAFQAICQGQGYVFNGINLTASGTYRTMLVGSTGCDSIITLHLTVNTLDSTTVYQHICQGQNYMFNGIACDTSGIYWDTLVNTNGCDSIITLHLTVDSIPLTVTQYGDTLLATGGVAYQWINCVQPYTIIPNATQPTFIVAMSGSYAVIATQGVCADTSACEAVIYSGLIPIQPLDEVIRFAPNPATYAITLLPTQPFEAATISIYAIDGQLIQRIERVQAVEYNLNVEQLAPGAYIMRISDGKRQYINKLIRA